jgi:hypothetical protein
MAVMNVKEDLLIVSIAVIFLSLVFMNRYEYHTVRFYTQLRKAIQDYWAILILLSSLVLIVVYRWYHFYVTKKLLDNSDAYRLYANPLNPGSPSICCGCITGAIRRVDPQADGSQSTCDEVSDPLFSAPSLDFMFHDFLERADSNPTSNRNLIANRSSCEDSHEVADF